MVGPNGQYLGRVCVGFEIDDREGMVDSVADGSVVDAMAVCGVMDFHITIS